MIPSGRSQWMTEVWIAGCDLDHDEIDRLARNTVERSKL